VPGALNTDPKGLNDSGQIVGNFTSGGTDHGFLYSNGVFSQIDVPGAVETEAWGINNSGQIVGFFSDNSGTDHGFLYSGGNFTNLDVPGKTFTQPRGINETGQIVGDFFDGTTFQGFVYMNGNFTTIDISGSLLTEANGINASGQIVGYSEDNTGFFHGFLATPSSMFVGTPGKANCYGQSVSTLARQYRGLNAAASALGYSDVSALQNAIVAFCGG
jgi:probable HAF family extracellular repeat protein